MARKPPATEQEYREALKLLEAGHSQTGPESVAELLQIPDGTIGRWATEWKQGGILGPDNTVDWEAFQVWVQKKVTPSRRRESPRQQPTLPTVDSPRMPTATAHAFIGDEIHALKEVIAWWRTQTAHGETTQQPTVPTMDSPRQPTLESPQVPTVEGPRTRRHILLNDDLWERAKGRAKQEGVSVGDLVNEAIQAYLGADRAPGGRIEGEEGWQP